VPNRGSDKVIEFAAKFPAWLASVKLFAADPAVLHSVSDAWLRAYESENRQWVLSSVEEVPQVDRKPDTWDVLDTAELTSLVFLSQFRGLT